MVFRRDDVALKKITLPGYRCIETARKPNERSTCMARNHLKLNPSKTELIWLGSSRRLKHCPMDALNIAGVSIKPSSYVRDLGVYVDGDLSLEAHISHLSRRHMLLSPSSATYRAPESLRIVILIFCIFQHY